MTVVARRWLVPLVAAFAVLAVIGVVWLQSVEAGRGGLGSAAGGSHSGSVGGGGDSGSQGDGSPPDSGSEPGMPGIDSPEPRPDRDVTPKPIASAPRDLIGIDSYYRYDDRHLALNFSNGVPECYGTAGEPMVEETPDAVVVTIPRVPPPPGNDDVACIDIALMLSVDVTLDEPLGDRAVLDGARERTPVPESDTAHDGSGPTY